MNLSKGILVPPKSLSTLNFTAEVLAGTDMLSVSISMRITLCQLHTTLLTCSSRWKSMTELECMGLTLGFQSPSKCFRRSASKLAHFIVVITSGSMRRCSQWETILTCIICIYMIWKRLIVIVMLKPTRTKTVATRCGLNLMMARITHMTNLPRRA